MSSNLLDNIGHLFSRPKEFFGEVAREKTIGYSLLTFLVCTLVSAIASFFMLGAFTSYTGLGFLGFGLPVITIVASIFIVFISSGLIHLFIKMFKGKGTYTNTFNAYAYGMSPAWLLTAIPIIGFLGGLYGLVLSIIGLSIVHKISVGKAIAAIVLASLLFFIVIILPLLLLFFFIVTPTF